MEGSDAHNGGGEAQNGVLEGLQVAQICITLTRSSIRILTRIKVKSWIRIRDPQPW
jgi:hypothetical protein